MNRARLLAALSVLIAGALTTVYLGLRHLSPDVPEYDTSGGLVWLEQNWKGRSAASSTTPARARRRCSCPTPGSWPSSSPPVASAFPHWHRAQDLIDAETDAVLASARTNRLPSTLESLRGASLPDIHAS